MELMFEFNTGKRLVKITAADCTWVAQYENTDDTTFKTGNGYYATVRKLMLAGF